MALGIEGVALKEEGKKSMLNHKKIRMARRLLNLTQHQISRKCGISQSYLSLLENGAVNPSVEIVSKIARLLNLKIDDIVEV